MDANDDPLAAIQTGIQAMRALDFCFRYATAARLDQESRRIEHRDFLRGLDQSTPEQLSMPDSPAAQAAQPASPAPQKMPALDEPLDIAPDLHLVEKVEEERRVSPESDLLNAAAPAK